MIKTSKGFSTASSEDDMKNKIKLENANKTIEYLKNKELRLVDKITKLENNEISLKETIGKLKDKVDFIKKGNETLISKLLCNEIT